MGDAFATIHLQYKYCVCASSNNVCTRGLINFMREVLMSERHSIQQADIFYSDDLHINWDANVDHLNTSGHYMYRQFNIQQFYVLHTQCTCVFCVDLRTNSFISLYSTVVTICTTSLTFSNSTFCPHSVFMCFVWIWEHTAIIFLYSINWMVFITEMECVHCAVRAKCLTIIQVSLCL